MTHKLLKRNRGYIILKILLVQYNKINTMKGILRQTGFFIKVKNPVIGEK
jgi:hypothetical protein